MSFLKTETFHNICFVHTQFNSFMNTLFKPLGLVEAQPRSAVEIKATVALEEGELCINKTLRHIISYSQ